MKFPTFARWPVIYVALIHHGKSISWFSRHNVLWWKRAISGRGKGPSPPKFVLRPSNPQLTPAYTQIQRSRLYSWENIFKLQVFFVMICIFSAKINKMQHVSGKSWTQQHTFHWNGTTVQIISDLVGECGFMGFVCEFYKFNCHVEWLALSCLFWKNTPKQ